ncbi:hypothetical protein ABFP36_26320, partial [Salmonella enterica subsp. enterica serovar Kentucky]
APPPPPPPPALWQSLALPARPILPQLLDLSLPVERRGGVLGCLTYLLASRVRPRLRSAPTACLAGRRPHPPPP